MKVAHSQFLRRFNHFISDKQLFSPADKILLAVSGGVDSTVMAYLFHKAGLNFAIAHCNFQLRGPESDADEAFVKDMAHNLGAPFHSIKFETAKYAVAHQLSIQMAARELRYEWFDQIIKTQGYAYLATAHHKDDQAETIILNLVKGSVLTGLHGILPKNGKIIRPLLWAEKSEIEEYAAHNKIHHREDQSNAENKYQRNIIRNQVIPLLQKINADLTETIYKAAGRRNQLEDWLHMQSEAAKVNLFKKKYDGYEITLKDLTENEIPAELFFTWVSGYGFNDDQVASLFADLDATESRSFFSTVKTETGKPSSYKMTKTRDRIIIAETTMPNDAKVAVNRNDTQVQVGQATFRIEILHPDAITAIKDPAITFLDLDKLDFPLLIRRWKTGDIFHPFGLKGSKKLSDFLTDLKLDALEKENQLVICSGHRICAVPGRRTDDRFKVSGRTRRVLMVVLQPSFVIHGRNF